MKKNEIVDLRAKTRDELLRLEQDLREEIGKISTERSLGKLKNTNIVRSKKRDLARILTFLTIRKETAQIE